MDAVMSAADLSDLMQRVLLRARDHRQLNDAGDGILHVVGYIAGLLPEPSCDCGERMQLWNDDGLISVWADDEQAIDTRWICRRRDPSHVLRLRYRPASGEVVAIVPGDGEPTGGLPS